MPPLEQLLTSQPNEQGITPGAVGMSEWLDAIRDSTEMCATCPFRRNDDERKTLTVMAKRAPHEFWPCHEAHEFDEFTERECQGHRQIANAAMASNQQIGGK